ncbi:MAG: tetratricopeptide repeat protein [Polyangiaceae bacterium]
MKRIASSLLAVSLLSVSIPGNADTQGDKAAAQAAFDLGRKLVLAGNFNDACPKFEESEKLDPGLGTMLFLADCYEKTGKTASAWGQFREAEAIALKQSDAREKVAHDRASALEPRLSKIIVRVDAAKKIDGLHVTRDAVEIGRGLWNVPFPIDPGPHDIGASAPGRKSWTEHVQITTNGSTFTIVVPTLLDDPDAVPTANPLVLTSKTKGGDQPLPPEKKQNDGSTQRVLGVAVAGAGVVSAVVGIFFGLHASARLDESNSDGRCGTNNHCTQIGVDDRSDANTAATVSDVTFIAGGALIAGGAALFFTAPHGRKSSAPAARFSPSVGPKSAGLSFGASW